MSIRADITRAMGWFAHERKIITISVDDGNGNAVNLAATNVAWRIMKFRGSTTVYLTKQNGSELTISGANSNVVTITINPTTDYNSLVAGIHWHELWDVDNNLELSYGDAHLLRSRGP